MKLKRLGCYIEESRCEDLFEKAKGGDEAAFEEIVRRKSNSLFRTIYKIVGDQEEAKDIVQMTFMKVWQHRDTYNSSYSFNTWLYRIATNIAIDFLRKKREKVSIERISNLRLVADEERYINNLKEKEVFKIFEKLSEYLSHRQKIAFVLREVECLPSSEVASILGCSESTVRNHIFSARKILRKKIEELYPEYLPSREEK